MPDHEDAVREARAASVLAACQFGDINKAVATHALLAARLDDLESAIRASERAKYAALVEAAAEAVRVSTPFHFETNRSVSALHRALAALQSKEGTNE